jgi:hypothetical protein
MDEALKHILWGLGAGLFVGLVFWLQKWSECLALRREIRALHGQLARDMQVRDKGNKSQQDELESLRRASENLRVTIKTLKGKPGRAELELLHIYDHAIHAMCERAPGFAPAWENALREARLRMEQSHTGLFAYVRRVFRPSLAQGTSGQIVDAAKAGKTGGLEI